MQLASVLCVWQDLTQMARRSYPGPLREVARVFQYVILWGRNASGNYVPPWLLNEYDSDNSNVEIVFLACDFVCLV